MQPLQCSLQAPDITFTRKKLGGQRNSHRFCNLYEEDRTDTRRINMDRATRTTRIAGSMWIARHRKQNVRLSTGNEREFPQRSVGRCYPSSEACIAKHTFGASCKVELVKTKLSHETFFKNCNLNLWKKLSCKVSLCCETSLLWDLCCETSFLRILFCEFLFAMIFFAVKLLCCVFLLWDLFAMIFLNVKLRATEV